VRPNEKGRGDVSERKEEEVDTSNQGKHQYRGANAPGEFAFEARNGMEKEGKKKSKKTARKTGLLKKGGDKE